MLAAATSSAKRVYPRVCGGTERHQHEQSLESGLSPRVRGNPENYDGGRISPGSIPACAGEPSPRAAPTPQFGVYPRVCGGTALAGGLPSGGSGLSPRVRGNPVAKRPEAVVYGSIPACAGEPASPRQWRPRPRVYPRVCGGTKRTFLWATSSTGLSPRVRGNPKVLAPDSETGGSIPACAGEPTARRFPSRWRGVYPRVCGGTWLGWRGGDCAEGLSPRVRGNLQNCARWFGLNGSIPACAGEPELVDGAVSCRGVYPRVCGGTQSAGDTQKRKAGLSPRVRGNPPDRKGVPVGRGSIPACAGEPSQSATLTTTGKVYPRVCGGTRSRALAGQPVGGLSPRVRGNLDDPAKDAVDLGSIPACAGEPTFAKGTRLPSRVYPRVCGGTCAASSRVRILRGLSPRVRGNPGRRPIPRPQRGSIPACAGEPARRRSPAIPTRVYPRVCGGTEIGCGCTAKNSGLSPRVRGNRACSGVSVSSVGSIPACAGEPRTDGVPPVQGWVYPRVCGGTRCKTFRRAPRPGLSPRVRGNLFGGAGAVEGGGSIPACAGEPRSAFLDAKPLGVYPRVCGGTCSSPTSPCLAKGLSPRVRGNHAQDVLPAASNGSIPACAGEPPTPRDSPRSERVYPRVCGGTRRRLRGKGQIEGLSPRVRGNPDAAVARGRLRGSIPACAGEPPWRSAFGARPRVYPRVCGGTPNRRSAGP